MTAEHMPHDLHAPTISLLTVGELKFNELAIPSFQRPYKWTAKNVNQLISDIIAFRNNASYRLGTLVLYNNEIVDGQQRIVTLVLLLTKMLSTLDEKARSRYKPVADKLSAFRQRIEFKNRYSLHNVVENVHVIDNREADFDRELLEFVLDKCEFVVIQLRDISEAFQFFDSQNARGKDLEAHDLLKAYHLREITTLTPRDSANIDDWQQCPTEQLKHIFLTLFRARQWSKGKSARFFTKDHTDLFKGVSVRPGKRYPFYQLEVIAHIFTNMYNDDATRIVDGQRMEYPFNLDDQIINGSRFFDMLRHYRQLYQELQDYRHTLPDGRAKTILNLVNGYDGAWRTGDKYVYEMFYTLLLYYVDRFGPEELDKVVPQFFLWAYRLRLQRPNVQLATVDNYASDTQSLFRAVYDAPSPYDIINLNIDGVDVKACSRCGEIVNLFKELKKYYGND